MKINDIAEWLLIADEDADSATILDKENNLSNSYYHCSQAVEKYLKGYLVANDVKVNKNHYILETLNRCINLDNSFSEILPECDKMTISVKNLRYPGRMIPSKHDIKDAFNLIEKIKTLKPIQDLYNKVIEKYGNNWKSVLFKKVANIEINTSPNTNDGGNESNSGDGT